MIAPRLGVALGGIVFLASTVLATGAVAQQARPVELRVTVVQALPEDGKDDPGCGDLRRRIGPMMGRLRLLQYRRMQLALGENGRVELPTGRPVRLLPINIHGGRLHMQLQVPGKVNTRMQMMPGKPVTLGGMRYKAGDLIVDIVPVFKGE